MRNFKFKILLLTAVLILAACQHSPRFANRSSHDYPKRMTSEESENKAFKDTNPIIIEAEKWLGTPYCYGGESSDCIDCSAFVQIVFGKKGINIPRTAAEQYEFTKRVNDSDKKPGDLVFFSTNRKITHVGIYAGGNEFIHSSSSQGVVRQSLTEDYYSGHLAGFGRVMN